MMSRAKRAESPASVRHQMRRADAPLLASGGAGRRAAWGASRQGCEGAGQDFVLFRDERGRHGLLDRDCPHRGADSPLGASSRRPALSVPRLAVDSTQVLETPADPKAACCVSA